MEGPGRRAPRGRRPGRRVPHPARGVPANVPRRALGRLHEGPARGVPQRRAGRQRAAALAPLRTPVNNIEYFPPNFEALVLGCIDADFCK